MARIRVSACSLVVLVGCSPPDLGACVDRVDPELRASGWIDDPPTSLALTVEPNLRVVTVNVGNMHAHGRYALRMRWQAYEDHIGAKLRALAPDVIALQEVLPRDACMDGTEAWERDEEATCYRADERPDAVRRLLGDGYSIVCDEVSGVDCLAVHRDYGTIEGLAAGGYAPRWHGTFELPGDLALCDYLDRECFEKVAACDAESSIVTATIATVTGAAIEVVHVHPSAFGQACRERQLSQAFAWLRDAKERAPDRGIMMLGDWNLDPDRLNRPTEEVLYYSHVGPERLLREHDERDEDCARVPTGPFELGTLDRVTTDFAHGFCGVLHESQVPIGESRARGRLDDDFEHWDVFEDGRRDDRRMDHRAVVCDLWVSGP
jgi:endonuclease/exonuclease/phosphatase family metal-dependent hydrolase